MTTSPSNPRVYAYTGCGPELAPSYERVARSLTADELVEEIAAGLGEPSYQEALRAELAARTERRT